MKKTSSTWLKNRGYIHITPQIDVKLKGREILNKVKNPNFVARHAFYPLLHSIIKERRYKPLVADSHRRGHSNNGAPTAKLRPLHYATHIDALIFGYYAEIILKKYEEILAQNKDLSECVTAYRKIEDPSSPGKFKSTINFANEAFNEIKKRSKTECVVLKFDIKSFFSALDHKILKKAWSNLLSLSVLPSDHYNVFKACTRFSYILKDDFRIRSNNGGRRFGFNEKKLANIRKTGRVAFFESNIEFRTLVKSGEIKLHKYPFRSTETQMPTGIPQGLPISAVLANLYLLEFDKLILNNVVGEFNAYYRRYSDDIIVVCDREDGDVIEKLVQAYIRLSNVVISPEKTEKFVFKNVYDKEHKPILVSFKLQNNILKNRYPFTYLGFEFNGQQILIKSANLARFYRRMVVAVKRKASRAVLISDKDPNSRVAVYRNQLIRLYSNISLKKIKITDKRKVLIKNKYGDFVYKSIPYQKKFRSNYFSYAKRASSIMGQPDINQQLNKHRNLFNMAIFKQINRFTKNN